MAKEAMSDLAFDKLLSFINMETDSADKKLDILFSSRGYFSALQASRIIYAIALPSDKVRAIQILEPRLCCMTCSEARDILSAFSIHCDKLICLDAVKRVLSDCQSSLGVQLILSAFVYEPDKYQALQILKTASSDVADLIAAGGHQGYAALGGLFTQSRPLVPHLYGSIEEQQLQQPGKGTIQVPIQSRQDMINSMYTGHPSYAYPQGSDYAYDKGYLSGAYIANKSS